MSKKKSEASGGHYVQKRQEKKGQGEEGQEQEEEIANVYNTT